MGKVASVTDEQLGAVDQAEVQRRYSDTSFVPSLTLAQIGPEVYDPDSARR